MSILVATHFSPGAERAASAAASLAQRTGQPLDLLHVMRPEAERAYGRTAREAASAALSAEAARLRALGAEVRMHLEAGRLEDVVQRVAQATGTRLAVVAAPERDVAMPGDTGGLERIADALTTPLLVVRDAQPFVDWAEGRRALRVALGVERDPPFEAARAWVADVCRLGRVEVVAVHAFWPHEAYRRYGLPPPRAFAQVTPELQHLLERDVAAQVAGLDGCAAALQVQLRPALGRLVDHLMEAASEARADVLVVGSHRRHGPQKLWSVSHHALRLSPTSVVSVPADARTVGEGVAPVALPQVRSALVATDFSAASERALRYACAVVGGSGTVHVASVSPEPPSAAQREGLRARLEAWAAPVVGAAGRHLELHALEGGDAARALGQACERAGADVLVLGRKGMGRTAALLGSVASRVAATSPRPVLLVSETD